MATSKVAPPQHSRDSSCGKARAYVPAILAMSKELNIKTVAEGVETKAQLKMLRNKGCDTMQGFYFSKPVKANELTKLLQSGKSLGADDWS